MSIEKQMRMERITRLIKELMYECERGFMEQEIDECIQCTHIVSLSRQITDGIVVCRFETRPVHRQSALGMQILSEPRIRLVKK